MEVIVDGVRDYRLEGEPADVFAVVASVSEFLRQRGRGVLSVQVDGENVLPDEMIDRLEGMALGAVDQLEVVSEDIAKLVQDSLRELEQAVPELPGLCHRLAEIFHGDAPEDGYEPFQQMANIWAHIKSREIQVVGALSLDFTVLELNGQPIETLHQDLNMYLAEAVEALEVRDCVLLGDLLEYELAPRAETEAEIVALLQSEARPPAQSN